MSLTNIRGPIHERGSAAVASSYQTAVHTRPDLVIEVADANDVQLAIGHAADRGLSVGTRATGHGAASVDAGMLLATNRLTQVTIDPENRLARVGAGVTWDAVVQQAARFGLAPLSGSAPTVGVVGYTLGGGTGPLTRRYGFAADHVTALDVVTADGQLRHVGRDNEPELFWAMRGGGGGFAVVVAMQFRLFPVDQVLSGALTFTPERFPEIVARYREWTANLPDELTSSLSYMTFPDSPSMPERIRGQRILRLFVTSTDPYRADAAISELGAWGATEYGLQSRRYAQTSAIFAEPSDPHGYQGDAAVTDSLDAVAAVTVADVLAAETENCYFLQIHHLGGQATEPAQPPNAVGHRDARYIVRVTSPIVGSAPAYLAREQTALIEGLAGPVERRAVNFLFGDNITTAQPRTCYEPNIYERLTDVKRTCDPSNMFRIGRVTVTDQ